MPDPTGASFGIAAGALTLTNTLIKLYQDNADDPDLPPRLADIIRVIPDAVMKGTQNVIAAVDALEQNCLEVQIDTSKPLELLKADTKIWQRHRRRVLDQFMGTVSAITNELEMLFDDVVAVSNCSESERLVARSYKQARERKQQLRRAVDDELPIATIVANLRNCAQDLLAEVGDMHRK